MPHSQIELILSSTPSFILGYLTTIRNHIGGLVWTDDVVLGLLISLDVFYRIQSFEAPSAPFQEYYHKLFSMCWCNRPKTMSGIEMPRTAARIETAIACAIRPESEHTLPI
jgi:hypothetical protein